MQSEDFVDALAFWVGRDEGWCAGYHAMLDGEDSFKKS